MKNDHGQNHEQSDFTKVVDEIRAAEEQRDQIVSLAKSEASNIVMKAKEEILTERVRAEDAVTALKNERLKKGSVEIESSVKKMLEKSRDDGAKLSSKKLDAVTVSKLAVEFLGTI